MKAYVLGFLFTVDLSHVLLQRKKRGPYPGLYARMRELETR